MVRSRTWVWRRLCLLALLGASLPTCGGGDSCIQVTCISGAWLHLPLSVPATSLAGATITVSRNGETHAAPLPVVPTPDSAGAGVVFTDTADVVGTLWQSPTLEVVLDLEWHVGDASLAVDGDHYVVTLTDAAATTTTLLDKTATYQATAPDPRQCEATATCSIAELTP